MKPTQEQIWNAAVALTASPKWVTMPGAVLSALTLAEIFERHTAHLEEPKPIPIRPEPTDEEWEVAASQPRGINNSLGQHAYRVSALAHHLAEKRAKVKP